MIVFIRLLISVILLITCYVLQGTVFAAISFGGVVPNLVLILTCSLALMRGQKTGLLIGFFSGLLVDIFSGSYIGFYAMLLMYMGFYAGTFSKVFYAEDIKLPLIVILSADFMYGFINYVFILLLKGKTDIFYYFRHIAIPECIYTALVAIILYPLILLINSRLDIHERKQAKQVGQQS